MSTSGYSVNAGKKATIEELKNVKDAAFFYINSHGIPAKNTDGSPSYALWTATDWSKDLDLRYKDDLDAGSLVPVSGINFDDSPSGGKLKRRYAVSSKFVYDHMSFAKKSFVFINTCISQSVGAKSFRETCFEKGATLYAGWNKPTSTPGNSLIALFMMDRILGANNTFISNLVPPENPPQRPFSVRSVYQDVQRVIPDIMKNPGFADDFAIDPETGLLGPVSSKNNKEGGSTLLLSPESNSGSSALDIILVPSIRCLSETDNQNLTVKGIFGSEQGSITFDGNQLNVTSWTPAQIVCDRPDPGGGKVVVDIRGHKSNEVPLTTWTLSNAQGSEINNLLSDYTGYEDYTQSFTGNCDFRGDVHGYREEPHGDIVLKTTLMSDPRSSNNQIVSTSASGYLLYYDGVPPVWYRRLQYDPNPAVSMPYHSTDLSKPAIYSWIYLTAFDTENGSMIIWPYIPNGIRSTDLISGSQDLLNLVYRKINTFTTKISSSNYNIEVTNGLNQVFSASDAGWGNSGTMTNTFTIPQMTPNPGTIPDISTTRH